MQKTTSPQEMAELELALEKTRQVPVFRTGLMIFWGLIVAKCLLAEWAAEVYHAPINTFLFVWVPSLLISGAITLVHAFSLFRELPRMPLSGRIVNATWVACAVGMVVLGLVSAVFGAFTVYLLPALAAVLLGVGFLIHSVVDRRMVYRVAAVGWWVSAIWLFAHPDVGALARMALCLFLFQVLPAGWLFYTQRKS
jgi:hypothetical protein